MNTRTTSSVVIALIVVAIAVFLSARSAGNSQARNQPTPSVSQSASTTPSTGPQSASYTLAQVATHNSQTSCWAAVNGNVYDLTSWISQHPGGKEAILSLCGKDGSVAFNNQHGKDQQPQQALATFKIGTLVR